MDKTIVKMKKKNKNFCNQLCKMQRWLAFASGGVFIVG